MRAILTRRGIRRNPRNRYAKRGQHVQGGLFAPLIGQGGLFGGSTPIVERKRRKAGSSERKGREASREQGRFTFGLPSLFD